MQILKNGNTRQKMRGECPQCGCMIECERSETRRLAGQPSDKPLEQTAAEATCPEFNHNQLIVQPC